MVNAMNLAKSVLVFFLLFSPLPVTGQDRPHVYAFADISCGAWVKSKEDQVTRQVYHYWFRGFVSGYNFGNPYNQVFMMPNDETLDLYVDKHCQEKPLDAFISAAFKLVEELTKN